MSVEVLVERFELIVLCGDALFDFIGLFTNGVAFARRRPGLPGADQQAERNEACEREHSLDFA